MWNVECGVQSVEVKISTKTQQLGKLHVCYFVSCCADSGDSSCRLVFWRTCFLIVFLFHLFFFNVLLKPTFFVEAGVAIQGQMNHIVFRVYPTISNHTLP